MEPFAPSPRRRCRLSLSSLGGDKNQEAHMSQNPSERAGMPSTAEALRRLLTFVFAGASSTTMSAEEAVERWRPLAGKGGRRPAHYWCEESGLVRAFLFGTSKKGPVGGIELTPLVKPTEADLRVLHRVVRVFDGDLRLAYRPRKDQETWETLRQTQFRRAIAKTSSFSTMPFIRWLQLVEGSTRLRYEGNPFALKLVMSKQLEWLTEPLGENWVQFGQAIPLEKALMHEKWLRGALQGERLAVGGVGHKGSVRGLFVLPDLEPQGDDHRYAPHQSFLPLQALLRDGTMAFATSSHGDIYVMLAGGEVFHNHQGRWRYLNYDHLHGVLKNHCPDEVAEAVIRAALDLSFERRGALICLPEDRYNASNFVPDYGKGNRANRTLRTAMEGLQITDWSQRQAVVSAAMVDGAIVVGRDGTVQDVACMVGDPDIADVKARGHGELLRDSGARTTAAWNASIYGTAIKVSEDGPLTVFHHGRKVLQL